MCLSLPGLCFIPISIVCTPYYMHDAALYYSKTMLTKNGLGSVLIKKQK